MAGFEALDAFLDDHLELPVEGRDGTTRTYRIEDPSAEDGLKVEKITTLAARLVAGGAAPTDSGLDDQEEIDLYRLCLGDTYEVLAAEVSWSRFKHAALTAMMWITADRETAEQYWASGAGLGKAPNRAARRQQAGRGSSAKAAATTTRKRASTSGTKAASRPRKTKAAAPDQS
ncbi:hypothetical protein [Streptomyces sp. AM 2-1-1]|uniref:DUF7426 family protein n=1 Tax=Streptomyces sp. AM 2-1-1 TaxID=3028709 RepID=UPI0023B897A5|nr:hypothetical protein [Streptomyces sp. AM 2-1-1]WEH40802.1 hypothetical protein PZB77_15530 [Streptomyces sp. AM 2-1-1]